MIVRWLKCSVLGLLLATPAVAQLPNPTLTQVYPPGATVGTSQFVTVSGRDLDDATHLLFSHPGIVGTARENAPGEFESRPSRIQNQFDVSVSENVPPGRYEVRVVGRFGASTPRSFFVEPGSIVLEAGQNHARTNAMDLQPNLVVYGRADGNAVDYYRIAAKKGETYSIECLSRGIDSRLSPVITVWAADGKQLRRSRVTVDPVVEFAVPADGNYVVGIHDHVYAGGADYFYRLDIRSQPFIAFTVPPIGRAGESATYQLVGLNLPFGTESSFKLGGVALQQREVRIYSPEARGRESTVHGGETRSYARESYPFQWKSSVGASNVVHIDLAELPIVLEGPDNDLPSQAQAIPIPAEYVGQFYPRRDQDWVEFAAKKGQKFQLRLLSNRLGHATDPEVFVQKVKVNAKGDESVSQVSVQDDASFDQSRYRSRLPRALDLSHHDPDVGFTADEDATYRIGLRDLYGSSRDDPRLWYRLQVSPQEQDFQLIAWSQRQAVDNDKKIQAASPVLRRGGNLLVYVDAIRRHGFSGPIKLTVEGLPAGVTALSDVIENGRSDGILVLKASEEAAAWTGAIRVIGVAEIGDRVTRRTARNAVLLADTGDVQNLRPRSRLTYDLVLSVIDQDPAPVALSMAERIVETSRGAKIEIPLAYHKSVNVKGELALAAIVGSNEIKPAELKLAADAKDGKLQVPLNSDKVPLGNHTIFLRGKVKIDYARNPQAIARAEADRKAFDAVLAGLGKQQEEITSALEKAKQRVADQSQRQSKFRGVHETARDAVELAAASAQKAVGQMKSLESIASSSSQDADIAEAVQKAQSASALAVTQLDLARQALTTVSNRMNEIAQTLETTQLEVSKLEAARQEVDEKKKRAEAHKQSLDKRIEEAKKNLGPKEVSSWVDSSPVTLRIHKSPVETKLEMEEVSLESESSAEVPFKISRRFGFTEGVDVELTMPDSAKGVATEVVSLSKDQSEGVLKISLSPEATKGEHRCLVKTKLKFNDLGIEDEMPFTLRIQ